MPQLKIGIKTSFIFLILAAFVAAFFGTASLAGYDNNNHASDIIKNFDEWSTLAEGRHVSPAYGNSRKFDLISEWTGPDGKSVRLVVRQPVYINAKKKIFITSPGPDLDARPVLEEAIKRMRRERANTISFTPGTYYFLSTEKKLNSHLLLEGLSDVVIEGNGSQLIFSQYNPGILVQQSKRLRIENLTLNFSLRTTSYGRIFKKGFKRILSIDDRYPVNDKDGISQIVELQSDGRTYLPGGGRFIFEPKGPNQVKFIGKQNYESNRFDKLNVGSRFMVFHHWYGPQAIKIDGHRDDNQTEDITISGVNFNAVPGMGVAVTGLKRGIAILDSKFLAPEDGRTPGGVEWDGIHIHLGGGDILLSKNRFELLGDDAINISNPIHPIRGLDVTSKKIMLGVSSRFILKDDVLAFFQPNGAYLGKATVTTKPIHVGNGVYQMTMDHLPEQLSSEAVVRDVNLITSRFQVSDNVIQNINGHGVLAQIPNGLIANNRIENIARNAIRLLSDVGTWNEGVGAFNVAIRNNSISNPGVDPALDFPWGVITAYSGANGRKLSDYFYNKYLEISNNSIENYRQGCISIISSRNVLVKGNKCSKSYSADSEYKELVILRSDDVVIEN